MNRILLCSLFLTAMPSALFAQQAYDVQPGKPAQLNGIDYGFEIRNERPIEIGKENFMRYEVSVYATNRSTCTKIIFPRQTFLSTDAPNLLATFDCLNATGKRLTSKSETVVAQPFTIPYQQKIKNSEGKEVTSTTNIQAGFMLRNGETVSNSFITIVPDGERPVMKVRIKDIPDL